MKNKTRRLAAFLLSAAVVITAVPGMQERVYAQKTGGYTESPKSENVPVVQETKSRLKKAEAVPSAYMNKLSELTIRYPGVRDQGKYDTCWAFSAIGLADGFIVKTVFATFTVSFIIDYTSAFLPVYSGDRLLSSLFGAVTGGAGLALVFARNATTGGVDTAAKLIKLKHPHLSMGRIILFFDILVVGSSFFVYRSVENLLYSIIVIYLSSKTIDYLLYGTGDGKLIFIVTEHSEEIKEKITKDFRRGVSVLNARGGYTDKEKSVLITAVKIQEAAFITAAVKETDPKAFSVITGADEIIGEGFRY